MEINYEEMKEKLKAYDLKTKVQLIALANLLKQRKAFDDKQDKELDQMEEAYEKSSDPLMKKQNQIISGERAPDEEELVELPKFVKEDEEIDKTNQEPIENYWLRVLKNSKALQEIFGAKDDDVLANLILIEAYDNKDTLECGIKFHFKDNEHFSDKLLTLDFVLDEKTNEPIKVLATKINWNQGKNIATKIVKKKKKKVTKVKEVDQHSFFTIFRTIDTQCDEFKNYPEEKQQELQNKLEISFDIARLIHDEVLPYSVEYFLDVHVESDDEIEGLDEMESGEDDEGEEELTKEEALRRMKEKRGFKK